ncbi:MAG: cysteine hydrolase [Syntrophobacterales bacterium]|nr:cysteine hydrolase [Syntrophobacterales bacterium]
MKKWMIVGALIVAVFAVILFCGIAQAQANKADLDKLRAKVASDRTALIVVDMQKDYLLKGGVLDKLGFDVIDGQNLAPRLDDFVNKARKHVKAVIHLKFTLLPHLRSPANIEHYQRVGLVRKHDPVFSEFYGVIPQEGDIIVPKYRYSGFISTYLDQTLRSLGITTLIVTGVATNVCVESTVRDGFMLDYSIVVPSDMTEGTSRHAKEWSLKTMGVFFGEIVDSQDLLTGWGVK